MAEVEGSLNLPIHILTPPRLRSTQDNGARAAADIVLLDGPTDVRIIVAVQGPLQGIVCERLKLVAEKTPEFIGIPLIYSMVIADEHLPLWWCGSEGVHGAYGTAKPVGSATGLP